MHSNITKCCVLIVLFTFTFLQAQSNREVMPIKTVTGDVSEVGSVNAPVIEVNQNPKFESVEAGGLTWDVHNITNIQTGYDLQSNASTQMVWYDLNTGLIHSLFTNSQESATWSDRTTKYFFSGDQGVNWIELGNVPTDGSRSGFPAITGLSTGAAVLANHSNSGGGGTRTQIFIDNSPGEFNLTTFDPGSVSDGDPIWPRTTVDLNDNVIFASSVNGQDSAYVNSLSAGVFSGYQTYPGDQAEQHGLAVSDGGKVGMAWNADDGPDDGDVFYWESTDNGVTWSVPVKIYNATPEISDTGFGAIRGVTCNFYGEEPAVVWEDALQIFSGGNFFPGVANQIWFWSPNVNGGNAMVIADSSNVPYAPSLGTNDVLVPVCRPVIGRSQTGGYLFVAFDVATDNVFPSPDTTTYFAGYFTWSSDGGNTWNAPEKYTPDAPLLDWRYPSIASVSPVTESGTATVHMVMQGDSIPGSTVNAAGMPVGVTAQYYHFSADINIVGVEDDVTAPADFSLGQNYPNPFNPRTRITYSLAAQSSVSLKVYDILGNEVVILVNTTQGTGVYEVNFNASNLASGLYFYTLKAGSFTSTKKMMLLK